MSRHRLPGRARGARFLLFLALGGGSFALSRLLGGPPPAAKVEIVVTAPQIEAARARFRRLHGRDPSAAEQRSAIERLVREAIVVHEARRLGLDRGDLVIRRRLRQKMDLLAAEAPAADEVDRVREAFDLGLDRDDLIVRRRLVQQMERLAVLAGGPVRIGPKAERAYYHRHRQRFVVPPRYGFQQVFVRGGGAPDRDRAVRLLAALQAAGPGPATAAGPGDAFPLGTSIPARSLARIAADFGAAFAAGVEAAPFGRWQGPIASAFGWHLVRLDTVVPASVRSFEEARATIRHALRAEAEQQRIERMVARLRAWCRVEVQWPAAEAAS